MNHLKTEEDFIRTIKDNNMLDGKSTVVIGVSGGADSVCLLILFHRLLTGKIVIPGLKDLPEPVVVHINHGIRKNAERDADFVEALCRRLNVPFILYEEDIPKLAGKMKISEEEAGRIKRYELFEKALGKKNGVIAVAHNADDNAETVVFNLLRGSSLNGLSGIKAVNGKIIRPLINIERTQIEEYLKDSGEDYVTDETNLCDEYTRNKIRHNIIEYSKNNITRAVVSNINRASESVREADGILGELADNAGEAAKNDDGTYSVSKLLCERPYIAKRVIYDALCMIAGRKKDITRIHVDAVYDLLGSHGNGKLDLKYGIKAVKEYDSLRFVIPDDEDNIPSGNIDTEKKILEEDIKGLTYRILEDFKETEIPRGLYTKWFDYDKICDVLTLRKRRTGDHISIDGFGSTKSVKSYMIDEKIPAAKRDDILLICDGDHVVWIIGYRISEYYKVGPGTKKVLEITINTEELK